jgi:hypothetical protein
MIGSAGLGNELFPWARAEIFARRNRVPVLAPRWGRLRIGPYLRREPEKRRYAGTFRAAEHVRGVARATIATLGRRMAEDEPEQAYAEAKRSSWPFTVAFQGMAGLFAVLAGEHEFIRSKLWQMTRPSLRPEGVVSPFIAIHVRRGDLTRQGFTRTELLDVKQFTPLSWFVSMAKAARRLEAAQSLRLIVFSDGSPEELAALLALDGVHLQRSRRAITDLWLMSKASALFASGFSTFGMWASYLGGMPTVYAPGKLQQRVHGGRAGGLELELAEGERLPPGMFGNQPVSAVPDHE